MKASMLSAHLDVSGVRGRGQDEEAVRLVGPQVAVPDQHLCHLRDRRCVRERGKAGIRTDEDGWMIP